MSAVEQRVIGKIMWRAQEGWKKYGTTMERQDLDLMQWMLHLQEELLDGAIYLQRIIDDTMLVEEE